MKTELVWEGKYDEYGNRRPVSLPDFPLVLQKIETVDEPRDRAAATAARQGDLFDQDAFTLTSHRDDFRNRLIWGDNKLALAALLEEFRGQVKLIYIDPPFDLHADFSLKMSIGEGGEIKKEQSVFEAVAYRDTWGRGLDSYCQMLFERLLLAKELLREDGQIFVHVGVQVNDLVRRLLGDVFGRDNQIEEIIWSYGTPSGGRSKANKLIKAHEYIINFAKSYGVHKYNKIYLPYSDQYVEQRFTFTDDDGRRYRTRGRPGGTYERQYLDESPGVPLSSVWTDIKQTYAMHLVHRANEETGYPTQKPESLLRRVLEISTDEGDLVLDFFSGSGTTLAVAEKMGRRWIGVDLGRFAVHTSRKRLIAIQRESHGQNVPYRSFDIYNLGRYERQWWQRERLRGADEGHREAVLKFFRAQPLENPPSPLIHATKAGAYVHVDKIDSILTLSELAEVVKAVHATGGRKVICLAWEFEMDLRLRARSLEAELGIDIQLKYIPREIMEPNRNKIQFFDAAAIEAEAFRREDGSSDVRLKTFLPSLTEVPEKELKMLRKRAVKSPFDFIDFWSIDFEHRDDKPFEHHWQDFRTRKDRSLKTESNAHWKYEGKGSRLICVKVIDVFGIDTTTVVEVKL